MLSFMGLTSILDPPSGIAPFAASRPAHRTRRDEVAPRAPDDPRSPPVGMVDLARPPDMTRPRFPATHRPLRRVVPGRFDVARIQHGSADRRRILMNFGDSGKPDFASPRP
jgi:hypothetical protein